MNLYNLFPPVPEPRTPSPFSGVMVATVTNNQDPEGWGRVKVQFPWLSEADESAWARVATLMAGPERGCYFLPEVGDEVLVTFERSDPRLPYIIGALWNGKDPPPVSNNDGKNAIKTIVSRSGHTIRLNDEEGAETIEIIDKTGKNRIAIDTASNSIAIAAEGDITLSAPNGKITLDAQELALKSAGEGAIAAGGNLDIKASGNLNQQGTTINLN